MTNALLFAPASLAAQAATPPAAAQNPSPMTEATRTHVRLARRPLGGTTRSFVGPMSKAVELWIPDGIEPGSKRQHPFDLVVHFHGAAWVPHQAVAALGHRTIAAVLNLGSGSGVYDRAFANAAAFDSLLVAIAREVTSVVAPADSTAPLAVGRVTLVGFSAGHGAVRAILRVPRHFERVTAVLLLDGMHTSYVPDGRTLANEGSLDTTNLVAFANFAREAMRGNKRFLVTHSEIFPGTFASTTETADWLLRAIGVTRKPVLRWGPRGMQQLSDARNQRFELMGFAGNSAPDHIDQFHAMPELLARLLR